MSTVAAGVMSGVFVEGAWSLAYASRPRELISALMRSGYRVFSFSANFSVEKLLALGLASNQAKRKAKEAKSKNLS